MQQGSHVSSSASEDFSLQSHPGAELGGAEARCQHLICSVVWTCTDFSPLKALQLTKLTVLKQLKISGKLDILTHSLLPSLVRMLGLWRCVALPRTTFEFLLFSTCPCSAVVSLNFHHYNLVSQCVAAKAASFPQPVTIILVN